MSKNFLILIFSLLFISNAFSQESMKDFYKFYNQGKYLKAIQELESVPGSRGFEKVRAFWIAISYKNLQQFERAVPYFKKAIKLGNRTESIYFEYAQTLYALNELEKARRAFRLSFNTGYKKPYCLYYLANISDILNNPSSTKKNYVRILRDKNADPAIKQIAYFQMGELLYSLVQNKFEVLKYVQEYIIPLWKRGYKILPDSEVARDIEERMDEVMYKFNIHPLQMVNGRRLGKKGSSVKGSITYESDDNVTLENEQSTTTATDISSGIIKVDLDMDYRYVFKQRFIVTPEASFNFVEHTNDTNPSVFTNDSYNINLSLKNKWEHTFFKKRASLLFDYDFSYMARDKNQVSKRSFYGRSSIVTIGQKARFFQRGDTTIKLKFKDFNSFNTNQNNTSTTFHFDQLWITESNKVLIGLFLYEDSSFNDTSLNNKSYLFRLDYVLPNIFWKGDLGLNTSANFVDNYNDSSRDIDKTLSFGFRYDKRISNNYKWNITYERSKATSDDASSEYSKNVIGTGIKISY
ncbi:MAG: tetratricopeptide repeat protein [Oligoflexia bacterium]|nr:tetratricopeptide repeat protein [Oligoflexia bacterium]